MGTRHEDQPAEHWAGPESLDPTPVWKQYALVALLLVVGLVVLVIVAVAALAPSFVAPPALVPGDRLVLSASDLTRPGSTPQEVNAPSLVGDHTSFWLTKTKGGAYHAFLTRWTPRRGDPACQVQVDPASSEVPRGFVAVCGPVRGTSHFSSTGAATDAARDLDQYLVSVSGDRVIVNLSRVIQADERTNAPVPTGIPQPQPTP